MASATRPSSPEAGRHSQGQNQNQNQNKAAKPAPSQPPSQSLSSRRPRRRPARGDRPCDICRKRKLKCVKEANQDKCVLCSFHSRECTYQDEPQRRKRRTRAEEETAAEGAATSETQASTASAATAVIATEDDVTADTSRDTRRKRVRMAGTIVVAAPADSQADETGDGQDRPAREDRHEEAPPDPAHTPPAPSLLESTLGLHRTTHFKYIGPGSLHEELLLDIIEASGGNGHSKNTSWAKFRRVNASTTFISRADQQTLFSAEDDDDIEAVESLVRPHGPALVNLYFRTVHPSYPILHKGVFLEKYARSYTEFSPPLLAAVYLLAMDWWEYGGLGTSKPDAGRLLQVATRALTAVIHRPKLSTVQANLLLLQRTSTGNSWVLTSQAVALAEELGLHVDCSSWAIPDWERRLRRRLAWAVFMQDKWAALVHGRPSHIVAPNWRMPPLALDDFPESARDQDDQDGSTEVEKGRLLFIHLARLTVIMAEALETLYGCGPDDQTARLQQQLFEGTANGGGNQSNTSGIMALLDLVKPIAVQLKAWASSLPSCLRMQEVTSRKLCSNGYLHLAYFVAEIMVCRFIVRLLPVEEEEEEEDTETDGSTPSSSSTLPPGVHGLCREAARSRLEHAMHFVEALRPEHLQAFWWFASPKLLAYVRTYGGLLWATSATDEEAAYYRQKLEQFRWSLKVRAKGAAFVTAALQEMEDNLQDIDMRQWPAGGRPAIFQMIRQRKRRRRSSGANQGHQHGSISSLSSSNSSSNTLVQPDTFSQPVLTSAAASATLVQSARSHHHFRYPEPPHLESLENEMGTTAGLKVTMAPSDPMFSSMPMAMDADKDALYALLDASTPNPEYGPSALDVAPQSFFLEYGSGI